MSNTTTYLARGACLTVGACLAGIGMYASYDAAAQSGSKYLMIAAPLVALAAPLTAVFVEIASEARQWIKAFALLLVFGLTATTVFYTAAERNHAGRAVGEAERAAYRTTVDRAKADLTEAKADAAKATATANKLRAGDGPKARSAKASEAAAIARVQTAEATLATAESKAVTESELKQADWLLPLAIDVANMVLIWAGFGLGKIERKPVAPTPTPVQVVEPVASTVRKPDPKRVEAGRKAAATRARNQAIAAGKVTAIR